MDHLLSKPKLIEFLTQLGNRARSKGACYLTGGSSALLIGWRESTLDVDIKFDPEPPGVFEAISELKRSLQINVQLASQDDFIPVSRNWKDHSPPIGQFGDLSAYHFDFTAQALAKIERGHPHDLLDVQEMLRRGLTSRPLLAAMLMEIQPSIKRYPALDEDDFIRRIQAYLGEIP